MFWAIIWITLAGVLSSMHGARPDSNFKSIHQQEWEVHQSDSAAGDTLHSASEIPRQAAVEINQSQRSIINVSLLLLIIVLLLVVIAVSILIRRLRRKEV